MKKIIVPTDFSELSKTAFELALLLASKVKANIELVHVVSPDDNTITLGEKQIRIKDLEEKLSEKVKKSNEKYPEVDIEFILKEGKVYKEVTSQAESIKESVIVTSTHGSSGWEDFFTGSNAYKIVASSARPVFTIRGKEIPKQINKIVLPLDTTPETREKVPFTAKVASLFDAEIHIVTVLTSDIRDLTHSLKEHAILVKKYLSKYNIESKIEQLHGDNITDMTIDYANKVKADMISIMSEQEKSLSNILLGSYAHQMINKSNLPVLVFPAKQIGIISESFKTQGINY